MKYGSMVDSTSNRNEYHEYFLGGRDVGLTTLPPLCVDCLEVWKPQPPETLRDCPGLYRDCFTFTFIFTHFLYLYVIGCSFKSKEHGK